MFVLILPAEASLLQLLAESADGLCAAANTSQSGEYPLRDVLCAAFGQQVEAINYIVAKSRLFAM